MIFQNQGSPHRNTQHQSSYQQFFNTIHSLQQAHKWFLNIQSQHQANQIQLYHFVSDLSNRFPLRLSLNLSHNGSPYFMCPDTVITSSWFLSKLEGEQQNEADVKQSSEGNERIFRVRNYANGSPLTIDGEELVAKIKTLESGENQCKLFNKKGEQYYLHQKKNEEKEKYVGSCRDLLISGENSLQVKFLKEKSGEAIKITPAKLLQHVSESISFHKSVYQTFLILLPIMQANLKGEKPNINFYDQDQNESSYDDEDNSFTRKISMLDYPAAVYDLFKSICVEHTNSLTNVLELGIADLLLDISEAIHSINTPSIDEKLTSQSRWGYEIVDDIICRFPSASELFGSRIRLIIQNFFQNPHQQHRADLLEKLLLNASNKKQINEKDFQLFLRKFKKLLRTTNLFRLNDESFQQIKHYLIVMKSLLSANTLHNFSLLKQFLRGFAFTIFNFQFCRVPSNSLKIKRKHGIAKNIEQFLEEEASENNISLKMYLEILVASCEGPDPSCCFEVEEILTADDLLSLANKVSFNSTIQYGILPLVLKLFRITQIENKKFREEWGKAKKILFQLDALCIDQVSKEETLFLIQNVCKDGKPNTWEEIERLETLGIRLGEKCGKVRGERIVLNPLNQPDREEYLKKEREEKAVLEIISECYEQKKRLMGERIVMLLTQSRSIVDIENHEEQQMIKKWMEEQHKAKNQFKIPWHEQIKNAHDWLIKLYEKPLHHGQWNIFQGWKAMHQLQLRGSLWKEIEKVVPVGIPQIDGIKGELEYHLRKNNGPKLNLNELWFKNLISKLNSYFQEFKNENADLFFLLRALVQKLQLEKQITSYLECSDDCQFAQVYLQCLGHILHPAHTEAIQWLAARSQTFLSIGQYYPSSLTILSFLFRNKAHQKADLLTMKCILQRGKKKRQEYNFVKAAHYLLCLQDMLILDGNAIKERQISLFNMLFSEQFIDLVPTQIGQLHQCPDQLDLTIYRDEEKYLAAIYNLLATLSVKLDEPKRSKIKLLFPKPFFAQFLSRENVCWQIKTTMITFFNRLYLNNLHFEMKEEERKFLDSQRQKYQLQQKMDRQPQLCEKAHLLSSYLRFACNQIRKISLLFSKKVMQRNQKIKSGWYYETTRGEVHKNLLQIMIGLSEVFSEGDLKFLLKVLLLREHKFDLANYIELLEEKPQTDEFEIETSKFIFFRPHPKINSSLHFCVIKLHSYIKMLEACQLKINTLDTIFRSNSRAIEDFIRQSVKKDLAIRIYSLKYLLSSDYFQTRLDTSLTLLSNINRTGSNILNYDYFNSLLKRQQASFQWRQLEDYALQKCLNSKDYSNLFRDKGYSRSLKKTPLMTSISEYRSNIESVRSACTHLEVQESKDLKLLSISQNNIKIFLSLYKFCSKDKNKVAFLEGLNNFIGNRPNQPSTKKEMDIFFKTVVEEIPQSINECLQKKRSNELIKEILNFCLSYLHNEKNSSSISILKNYFSKDTIWAMLKFVIHAKETDFENRGSQKWKYFCYNPEIWRVSKDGLLMITNCNSSVEWRQRKNQIQIHHKVYEILSLLLYSSTKSQHQELLQVLLHNEGQGQLNMYQTVIKCLVDFIDHIDRHSVNVSANIIKFVHACIRGSSSTFDSLIKSNIFHSLAKKTLFLSEHKNMQLLGFELAEYENQYQPQLNKFRKINLKAITIATSILQTQSISLIENLVNQLNSQWIWHVFRFTLDRVAYLKKNKQEQEIENNYQKYPFKEIPSLLKIAPHQLSLEDEEIEELMLDLCRIVSFLLTLEKGKKLVNGVPKKNIDKIIEGFIIAGKKQMQNFDEICMHLESLVTHIEVKIGGLQTIFFPKKQAFHLSQEFRNEIMMKVDRSSHEKKIKSLLYFAHSIAGVSFMSFSPINLLCTNTLFRLYLKHTIKERKRDQNIKKTDHQIYADKKKICYVCNQSIDQMEENGQNFGGHISSHWLWSYLSFCVFVEKLGDEEKSLAEDEIVRQIHRGQIAWVPHRQGGRQQTFSLAQLGLQISQYHI